MKNRFRRKADSKKKTAMDHVEQLFDQAGTMSDQELANRYVNIARTIAMKFKLKIPSRLQRKFCKHCYSYLRPSVNARVRVHESRVITLCMRCKRFTRIPIK